jgi:chemotaxis protein MotB
LSSERANASRRELILGGMSDAKILRVVGLGSAAHLDRQDPFNPINRRISIIVMNKKTEEAVMRDNASLQVSDQAGAQAAAAQAAP